MNSEIQDHMGRLKGNFTLSLLLIIVIEMAAFFYLSAEPGVFSRPSVIRSQIQSEQSDEQHGERKVLTVQLAILGYDCNNLPLAKLSVHNASQLSEGYFKVLLTDVICASFLTEKFESINGWFISGSKSGLASALKSPIPIAYRQLLI